MPLQGEYAPSRSAWVRDQVARYEASDGAKGGHLQGRPVVILTTRGARSGRLRKAPLMRVERGGTYLVVASRGGAATDPQWAHNIRAHPEIELQDRTDRWDLVGRELEGREREVWWDRAVEAFPAYARYQDKTSRLIPIFLLEPPAA